MNFQTTLRAEFLKTKRTSLTYFTLLAAVFVPTIMLLDNLDGTPSKNLKADPFWAFYSEGWMYIAFLILPMFIVLISTLLLQIEHKNNAWKQVLASPQQFYTLLVSKFIILQAFIIGMLLAHNLLMLASAVTIDFLNPDFHILNNLDLEKLLLVNGRTYFAALGMSGFQFWLALRFRNFIAPLGCGLLLCIMSPLMAFEFNLESILDKFPFAFSVLVNIPKFKAVSVGIQWLSVGYMLAFLAIALLEFNWKKVKS